MKDMKNIKEEDKVIVVSARCIDMVPVSLEIDKAKCGECGEMTWLSTVWRGRKIDRIVCMHCYEKVKMELEFEEKTTNMTEDCLNEAVNVARNIFGFKGSDKDIRNRVLKTLEDRIGEKINIMK